MKVLHLSSEASWRGGEQQIAYLIEEHIRLGIQCVVICRTDSAFARYCVEKNIPYYTLSLRNSLDVASALRIKQISKKENIDLIHVHSSRGHAITHLAQIFGMTTPKVLTRRVAFPIANKFLNIRRYNSSRLLKIICISKAVELATAPVVDKKYKLEVIYSGIDLSRFKNPPVQGSLYEELNLAPNTPLVGTVAALTEEKDLHTFIHAAKVIAAAMSKVHFVIVGDGPELKALQALAEKLNLADRLHFIGRRNNIPQLLPQFKLFLFTSRMEGLGTSVLDAFACKVPVVATAAGGVPEMVKHEETGMLAAIGDAASLAEFAIKVLTNSDLQLQLIGQAYALLIQKFTKERMAAETLRVYQEVLVKRN